jgi:uncharacterized DUF497 family protein
MYEWDPQKARANIAKHGVSFEVAIRIFEGPVLNRYDDSYEYHELREISIGRVGSIVVLVVVHTDRLGSTRIISARPANRSERVRYETELQRSP